MLVAYEADNFCLHLIFYYVACFVKSLQYVKWLRAKLCCILCCFYAYLFV